MGRKEMCAGLFGLFVALAAPAAVIGHMAPAEPLTEARIRALAPTGQAPWLAYLARSRSLMDADKAVLAAERVGQAGPAAAPEGRPGAGMPLNQSAAWYATPQARHVADNILSFQTPAGGWGKNVDRSGPVRARGQGYVAGEEGWRFVGTIDNDATVTELRFLARVQAQASGAAGRAYRESFLKGVRYLLLAQFPNGGFPQVYPLEGGYHDALTFNDDAMVNTVRLLTDVARRGGDYAFVPSDLAAETGAAVDRAIRLIVATQVRVGGVATGWAQQYDTLTLAPAGARNFEPVALATSESAGLLLFLMDLPDPAPDVVVAVHAGAAWLERVALRDVAWTVPSPEVGRRLVARPGAGPIWARYVDIATMQPVFGDRDRSIHDDVNEISAERRNGYGWYGDRPAKTLARYAAWARAHPLQRK